MLKEEVEQLKKLAKPFINDCERVVKIIGKFGVFNQCGSGCLAFADTFRVTEDEQIWWEGDEYWNYGGYEHHSGTFPIEYLAMTDEELLAEGTRLNEEYLEKKRKEKEEEEKKNKEAKKKRDYATYLRLKKEFE